MHSLYIVKKINIIWTLSFILVACGGGETALDFVFGNCPQSDSLCSSWIENNTEQSSYIKENASSEGVLVNVQNASLETASGKEYILVEASGIPDYQVIASNTLITQLNNRPRANTDFVGGSTTLMNAAAIQFGQDIGYASETSCVGFGYWPPGTSCPENSSHTIYFPRDPTPSDIECEMEFGRIGLWINGVAIYSWSDNTSFNNQNLWHSLAPYSQQLDSDICDGDSNDGEYHHHAYSSCLAYSAGEDNSGHSPIYGYAADGYPLYGPRESATELAKSSWAIREYNNAGSATGCSTANTRNCVLNNPYDISEGKTIVTVGPTTSSSVTSASGNTFIATAGYYIEDYYWDSDLTEQGGAYLDQHNGHSDSTRGYHYHVTLVENVDEELIPAFPFTVGPRFYGKLENNATVSCN